MTEREGERGEEIAITVMHVGGGGGGVNQTENGVQLQSFLKRRWSAVCAWRMERERCTVGIGE